MASPVLNTRTHTDNLTKEATEEIVEIVSDLVVSFLKGTTELKSMERAEGEDNV